MQTLIKHNLTGRKCYLLLASCLSGVPSRHNWFLQTDRSKSEIKCQVNGAKSLIYLLTVK